MVPILSGSLPLKLRGITASCPPEPLHGTAKNLAFAARRAASAALDSTFKFETLSKKHPKINLRSRIRENKMEYHSDCCVALTSRCLNLVERTTDFVVGTYYANTHTHTHTHKSAISLRAESRD